MLSRLMLMLVAVEEIKRNVEKFVKAANAAEEDRIKTEAALILVADVEAKVSTLLTSAQNIADTKSKRRTIWRSACMIVVVLSGLLSGIILYDISQTDDNVSTLLTVGLYARDSQNVIDGPSLSVQPAISSGIFSKDAYSLAVQFELRPRGSALLVLRGIRNECDDSQFIHKKAEPNNSNHEFHLIKRFVNNEAVARTVSIECPLSDEPSRRTFVNRELHIIYGSHEDFNQNHGLNPLKGKGLISPAVLDLEPLVIGSNETLRLLGGIDPASEKAKQLANVRGAANTESAADKARLFIDRESSERVLDASDAASSVSASWADESSASRRDLLILVLGTLLALFLTFLLEVLRSFILD